MLNKTKNIVYWTKYLVHQMHKHSDEQGLWIMVLYYSSVLYEEIDLLKQTMQLILFPKAV